jgi:hypothetical protein
MEQKSALISGTIRPYFGGGSSFQHAYAANSPNTAERPVVRKKPATQSRRDETGHPRTTAGSPPDSTLDLETTGQEWPTLDVDTQPKALIDDQNIPVAEAIEREVDVKSMVASVARAAGWPLSQNAGLWQVTIEVTNDRRQTVFIQSGVKDKSGNDNLLFKSIAGPADDVNPIALLRYNSQVLHAAFAVEELGGQNMVVVRGNLPCQSANEAAIRHVIDTVASYADKVERRVTGGDQY